MSDEKIVKETFFKAFCKKGYLLLSVFLAALFFSVAAFLNHRQTLSTLFDQKNGVIIAVAFIYFAVLLAGYAALSAFKKGVCSGDAVSFSFVLGGLFYLIFLLAKGSYTTARVVIAAALIVYGLAFFMVSDGKFEKGKEYKCPCYVGALLRKFSFLAVLLVAAVLICAEFLALRAHFDVFRFSGAGYIPLAICAAVLLIAAIDTLTNGKITVLDAVLFALAIVSPLIAFNGIYGYFTDNAGIRNVLLSAGIIFIVAVALVFRFVNYRSGNEKAAPAYGKTGFGAYFTAFNRKYSLLSVIGAGAFAAALITYIFRYTDMLNKLGTFRTFKFAAATEFYALAAINVTVIVALAIACALSFIGINADRVTSADFSIVFVISFCVFGLLSDIVVFNAFKTIALPLILVFEISILVSRIRKLSDVKG